MKKVLTDEDALEYYINGSKKTNNQVRGFSSRLNDSVYMSHNYSDVVETNRLDYVVKGKRPFPEGKNCHWEMEYSKQWRYIKNRYTIW